MTNEEIQAIRQQYKYDPTTLKTGMESPITSVDSRLAKFRGEETSIITPKTRTQVAHGQTKAFVGGTAEALGGVAGDVVDYLGKRYVEVQPEGSTILGVPKEQALQNLENKPSTRDQIFGEAFGGNEHPTARTAGNVVGVAASLVPSAVKLAGTEAGKQVLGRAGQISKGIAKSLDESLPVAPKTAVKPEFALGLVSPKPTTAVKELALKQGRVTERGILKSSKILPSKRDTQLADAVKPFISNKSSPTQNINSIDKGVKAINEGVKTYVKENKVPFNTNQLKTQLNKGKDELNLIFASDTNAKKTYAAVSKEFIKHVKSKDTEGLLLARQEFDKIPAIKKLLESQGLGENTKKEIVLTTRDMANRYVANLLPKGNRYRAALLQESKMIEAMGNIAEKNAGTIGKNQIQLLNEKYPFLKFIVGAGLLGSGVGAGGTLIGSLD